jgi:hypothetical protein
MGEALMDNESLREARTSFQETCPHERIVLVESGYEREWEWTDEDGVKTATEEWPESFSDEGDGVFVLRCKTCLKEFGEPEGEWEYE